MNAIIVSDLHMGSHYFQSDAFAGFINRLPDFDELILNGDVLDRPQVKLALLHQQNLDCIEQLSYRHKVVWLRGNHDNGYMPKRLGKIEFCRRYIFNRQIFITHGDDFDNIMPHSRIFMKAFRQMHDLRVRLGARPVHVAEYAKKWKAFYRVLRNNVMRNAVSFAHENGYKAITCGHTHFAEDLLLNGVRYINTGAWTELPAHYLYVTPKTMRLSRVDQVCPCSRGQNAAPNFSKHKTAVVDGSHAIL